MERLSGLDALFLYIETPAMHTHVALAAVLDPSTASGGYSFERIRSHIADSVHLVPPFRRRVLEVPLRVHHPVWVDDAAFDIDNHVKRAALPAPGGMAELADFTAHVASIPLDRSRPLWEMWVVEGLDDGRIALVAKIHHSAMDGGSGVELMPAFFDLEPEPPVGDPLPAWAPEPMPNEWEMLGQAGVERLRSLTGLVPLARRTGQAIASIRRSRRIPGRPPAGTPLTAPRTPFNGPITGERRVAFARLSLGDVKRVRKAFGATVNDVLLATCAGAVRSYLAGRGAIPDQPLVVACPVSTRSEADRGQTGNRLSAMFTPLHTEAASPLTCLEATTRTAASAKEEHEVLGGSLLPAWAELVDPLAVPALVGLYSRADLAARHRPAVNFVLSNVAGPPFPVYLAGCRMERAFPMGPVIEGAGLNVTVLSYRDFVDFGFMAAASLVPDVAELAQSVPAAFAELLEAAGERETPRDGRLADASHTR